MNELLQEVLMRSQHLCGRAEEAVPGESSSRGCSPPSLSAKAVEAMEEKAPQRSRAGI